MKQQYNNNTNIQYPNTFVPTQKYTNTLIADGKTALRNPPALRFLPASHNSNTTQQPQYRQRGRAVCLGFRASFGRLLVHSVRSILAPVHIENRSRLFPPHLLEFNTPFVGRRSTGSALSVSRTRAVGLIFRKRAIISPRAHTQIRASHARFSERETAPHAR